MKKILLLILLLCFTINILAENTAFPLREKFPHIQIITLNDLYDKRDEVTIIDTRSRREYEYIHIEGSVNIYVNDTKFIYKIEEVAKKHNRPLVFYCYGHKCPISFNAADQIYRLANVENEIYVFDGGIFDWEAAYPDLLEPRGISSKDLVKLIKSKSIQWEQFQTLYLDDRTIAVDIRELRMRAKFGPLFFSRDYFIRWDQDDAIKKLVDLAEKKQLTLLIYDTAGVRYFTIVPYFKKRQFNNFYFLQGGATEIFRK